MIRRKFITLLGGAAAAWASAGHAQQSEQMRRIGVLSAGSVELTSPSMTVLPDALRGLGWTEGKNVTFERRYADNRVERLPELAAELVQLNVDVIFAVGSLAPLAGLITVEDPLTFTYRGSSSRTLQQSIDCQRFMDLRNL